LHDLYFSGFSEQVLQVPLFFHLLGILSVQKWETEKGGGRDLAKGIFLCKRSGTGSSKRDMNEFGKTCSNSKVVRKRRKNVWPRPAEEFLKQKIRALFGSGSSKKDTTEFGKIGTAY
jgi:hypothetical protein